VFQSLQYCSGPKPFHWKGVELRNAPLANYDKLIIKVLDSTNNTVLLTKDLLAANVMAADITSLDAITIGKPLKLEVEYTPKAGTSDKPEIIAKYDAPPTEFCFKSIHTCKQIKITNVVETRDPLDINKTVSIKVDVDQPKVCPIIIVPPPPLCGVAGMPPCEETPKCGQSGQPACEEKSKCGEIGQLPCKPCIPGTKDCPIIVVPSCLPGTPGFPLCMTCASPPCIGIPPPPPRPKFLEEEKPKQSVAEEFKAPKVACAPKVKNEIKNIDAATKPVVPKPRPKQTASVPVVRKDPSASPVAISKPKPKPRAKAASQKALGVDDCD
jgi:hypothetical protein